MIRFPADPTLGQIYVAENAVTYTWLGDRWRSVAAITQGTAQYYREGGDAATDYFYDELDGGDVDRLRLYVTNVTVHQ